jgi:hypothetical protein
MSDSLKREIAAIRKREAELDRTTAKCLTEFRRELRSVLAQEARRFEYRNRPYVWKAIPGQGYGIYSESGELVRTVSDSHEASMIVAKSVMQGVWR